MVANIFGNKSCMQPMKGSACPNKGPVFFFLGRRGGVGGGIFFFFLFGGCSPGRKWWQTVLERNVPCSQWKAQYGLMSSPVFFFLGGRNFYFFSLVPIMFPMCSHEVPQFPKLFPQNVLNSTSALSHMVCPKFNSHVYKLKKVDHREHISIYFALGGPKSCIYWGIPNVRKKLVMGQSIWPLQKNKIKLSAPIN